ncbi:MAG: FHA domain-containing protein, partial [Myxococcota bacterium]|nr:FHA domain-containing protein [Myxococcota bacterium]
MLLSPGVTQIGRAEDNDIVLSDVGVSRRHARIQVGESGVRITDIGSGNGIFYRGSRIREQDLVNGDEVLVDPFVLTFHIRRTEPNRSSDDPDTAPIKRRHIQPDRAPPAARLVVLTGHRLASSYNLGERGLTLGRSEQRDIVLFDPAASRLHVDIRAEADSYWIRDKGSANGTFLNGKRIREQPLGHGDRLRVGGTEFRFEVLREGLDLETTVSDVGLQAAAGHVMTPPPLPIEGPTIPLDLSSRHHQDWEPAPSPTRNREPVGLGAWSLLAAASLLALG